MAAHEAQMGHTWDHCSGHRSGGELDALVPPPEARFIRLPYLPLTPTSCGVDDPRSKFYNQVVDSSRVEADWGSCEIMLRSDDLYRWGAFIAYNPARKPQAGSCIFLHVWNGPESSTAGCTAMAEDDLKSLLAWLDPSAHPRLVQTWVATTG